MSQQDAAKDGGSEGSTSKQPSPAAVAKAVATRKKSRGGSAQYIIAAISVLLSSIAVAYILGAFSFGGESSFAEKGGSSANSEALPPADARASIKFKKPIEEIWEYVALPNTWPLWQAGWDQVSGEIDTVAEAGNRVRAHISGPAGHGADREIQWTVMQVKEPKYSVDGDGLLWAVGRDVRQQEWAFDLRMLLRPLRRGRMTNFTQVIPVNEFPLPFFFPLSIESFVHYDVLCRHCIGRAVVAPAVAELLRE
eukprot:SAG31_NODE_4743_length_2986_cov_4.941808_4_plen_252_part_00